MMILKKHSQIRSMGLTWKMSSLKILEKGNFTEVDFMGMMKDEGKLPLIQSSKLYSRVNK